MVNFDCPVCSKRIENVAAHHGQTACPFCLQIITISSPQPEFAEIVQPVAEVAALDEKILEAEIVPAGPGENSPQPSAAMALLDPAFSEEAAAVETVEDVPEEYSDEEPVRTVDWREVQDAEERMHRRRVRKMVISWLVLMFNLSALVGFTYFAVDMWDINRAASFVCISGASSTFFFLAVQFWPRRRRRPPKVQEG